MTLAALVALGGLASIPSPSSNAIEIGPLQLNAYGLMIALGVLAAVWLAGRRLERKGAGTMLHLMETGGYVAPDDERLGKLLEKLEYNEGKCLCVGGYPEPPVYDDKVGKNAPNSAVPAAPAKKKASS